MALYEIHYQLTAQQQAALAAPEKITVGKNRRGYVRHLAAGPDFADLASVRN